MQDAQVVRRRIVVGVGSAVAGVLTAGLLATAGSDSSLASFGYHTNPVVKPKPVVIRATVGRMVRRNRFRVICRISGGVGIRRCRVSTSARIKGRRRPVGRGSKALVGGRARVTVRLNRIGRRALRRSIRRRLRVRLAVAPVPAQSGVKPLRKRATLVRVRVRHRG
jgi:hypothetical protein